MTKRFVPLSRIAALSVAITLPAAPIAAAQSPEAAPSIAAQANTALLSPAFARLVQPLPADVAPAAAVADPPRRSLFRQGTTATARQAPSAAMKAPQGSWGSRHPTAKGWLIIAGVVGGVFAGVMIWGAICNGCFE